MKDCNKIQLKESYIEWIKEDIKHFNNPYFATLTYKNNPSETTIRKDLKKLWHILSHKIYGKAAKRYNKKIKMLPVLEGKFNRHVHMIMDFPYENKIANIISGNRLKKEIWNHGISEIEKYDFNKKGIEYLFKLKSKTNYSDNIILDYM